VSAFASSWACVVFCDIPSISIRVACSRYAYLYALFGVFEEIAHNSHGLGIDSQIANQGSHR